MSNRRLASRHSFTCATAATLAGVALSRGIVLGHTPATIRIVALPTDVSALPFYAQENGFFADAGLQADVRTMSNGAAILAAVAGGAADVGASNIGTIAAGVLHGLPFDVIAPGGLYQSSHPVTLLTVAIHSRLRGALDLNGKKVAVNGLRDVQEAGVRAWIDQNGGDSQTVRFVELPFGEMGAALDADRVDAALITEPALTESRQQVRIFGKAFDAIAPKFQIVVWAANADWIRRSRQSAHRFARTMQRTIKWANANHAASEKILLKYTKVPEAVAQEMTRVRYATSLERGELQPVIDVMAKYGFLAKSIDATRLIVSV